MDPVEYPDSEILVFHHYMSSLCLELWSDNSFRLDVMIDCASKMLHRTCSNAADEYMELIRKAA